jgi:hypothetical protein
MKAALGKDLDSLSAIMRLIVTDRLALDSRLIRSRFTAAAAGAAKDEASGAAYIFILIRTP